MAKPKKEKPPKVEHRVVDGECELCLRSGEGLKIACPGYYTAAEYVNWKNKPPRGGHKGRKK